MVIYRCEDSAEAIFTAVYQAYEDKCDHSDTCISTTDEPVLFAEDRAVLPDREKAAKVINTVRRRFGESDYWRICMVLSAAVPEKAQAVYQTIVQGLAGNCRSGHLFDNLTNAQVHTAFALARAAGNEWSHLRGFLRFQELESGVLYSKIGPKNDVLAFLMPHFADRLPMENFLIYDEGRGIFGVHPAGGEWYLLQSAELEQEVADPRLSEHEKACQELFRYFCGKISIAERCNLRLQMTMLPLRFRKYMVEF